MNITWHGHSCFSFEDKINNIPVSIVTDPYSNEIGLRLPKLSADIVTVSHFHDDHANISGVKGADNEEPLIIDRPGEYERKGVFIQGIGSYHDKSEGAERGKSTIYLFDIAGVKIAHLGDLGTLLSAKQVEKLGDVDILLVPVGEKFTITVKEAVEIVKQLEPRIVIPMHYKIQGLNIDLEGLEKFQKELGQKGEALNKLKITQRDLLNEETKLVILEKN